MSGSSATILDSGPLSPFLQSVSLRTSELLFSNYALTRDSSWIEMAEAVAASPTPFRVSGMMEDNFLATSDPDWLDIGARLRACFNPAQEADEDAVTTAIAVEDPRPRPRPRPDPLPDTTTKEEMPPLRNITNGCARCNRPISATSWPQPGPVGVEVESPDVALKFGEENIDPEVVMALAKDKKMATGLHSPPGRRRRMQPDVLRRGILNTNLLQRLKTMK